MKIIIDSREQAPFTFGDYDCEAVSGSLPTGDYSLAHLEHQIAIERKSLSDLVGCLFCGSRGQAEAVTYHLLRLYLKGAEKRLRSIARAHGEACKYQEENRDVQV